MAGAEEGGVMVHEQDYVPWCHGTRFYAYCACGVVGPLRLTSSAAEADERGHAQVCSSTRKAAA
jgi:hypothetical protein